MNKKYRDIADKFEISEDIRESIIRGIGTEDLNRNPSKDKLDGFTSICEQIKNGTNHEEAIANYMQSREQVNEDIGGLTPEMITFVEAQAERAAISAINSLPSVAIEEQETLKNAFRQKYRGTIMKKMSDPSFREDFTRQIDAVVIEEKKTVPLLETNQSNIALPGS